MIPACRPLIYALRHTYLEFEKYTPFENSLVIPLKLIPWRRNFCRHIRQIPLMTCMTCNKVTTLTNYGVLRLGTGFHFRVLRWYQNLNFCINFTLYLLICPTVPQPTWWPHGHLLAVGKSCFRHPFRGNFLTKSQTQTTAPPGQGKIQNQTPRACRGKYFF